MAVTDPRIRAAIDDGEVRSAFRAHSAADQDRSVEPSDQRATCRTNNLAPAIGGRAGIDPGVVGGVTASPRLSPGRKDLVRGRRLIGWQPHDDKSALHRAMTRIATVGEFSHRTSELAAILCCKRIRD